MLLGVLELSDFALITVIVVVFAGGAAATASLRPAERARLRRIEDKLDLILTQLGVDYTPPPTAAWQELADDPSRKIAAIKLYREEHGVGLAEAKQAVEAYIDGRRAPS